MGNKAGLTRAILVLLFLGGFAWLVFRRHEPFYQGRPLSFWLENAYRTGAYQIDGAAPDTERAVREIGASAVPDLMLLLRSGTYIPTLIMGNMSDETKLAFLHLPSLEYRAPMVAWALKRLGPEAKPAVPELIRLLASKDSDVQNAAADCLAAIGPCAEPAVPALLAAWKKDPSLETSVLKALRETGPGARAALPELTGNTDPRLAEFTTLRIKGESIMPFVERLNDKSWSNSWGLTASLIAELGTNGEPAVPSIVSALRAIPATNTSDLQVAIEALGQIHCHPEVCVPALIPFLKSNDFEQRRRAVVALGAFGTNAMSAVDDLIRCMGENYSQVGAEATNALRVIDPAALAKPSKARKKVKTR